MYLPAMPSIGASLNADPDTVLMSLTAFFATFAIGQLVYGPVSDMVGRKPPLYLGLVLFLAASIGCAVAPDIHTLTLLRLVQGVGGAAGCIIARAIVRDLHSGLDEARLLSLLMLVFSVSPILAPLIGSGVIALASWRGVFWLVAIAALAGIGLTAGFVPETRSRQARADSSLGTMLSASVVLLTDRTFLGLTFVGAFGISGFFVFLANSSFVLMGQYGLSPTGYSLAFSANAAAFFAASQMNGWLGARFGLAPLVRPAAFGYAAAVVLLAVLTLAGQHQLFLMCGLLFVGYGFLGVVLPVTSVLAMAEHGAIAGTASSLMGTLQLAVGAVVMAVSGALADGSSRPMVFGVALCAVLAAGLAHVTLRRTPAPQRMPVPERT
jgi:DHA1 family bicyclomycin/chloramphenicol resistance-like MFS transporter